MHIGTHGLYRAQESHHTVTTKGDAVEFEGSVHHPQMREFFATVGRVHADGTVDVGLLVPGRPSVSWIDHVKIGEGFGEFEPEGHLPERREK